MLRILSQLLKVYIAVAQQLVMIITLEMVLCYLYSYHSVRTGGWQLLAGSSWIDALPGYVAKALFDSNIEHETDTFPNVGSLALKPENQ